MAKRRRYSPEEIERGLTALALRHWTLLCASLIPLGATLGYLIGLQIHETCT